MKTLVTSFAAALCLLTSVTLNAQLNVSPSNDGNALASSILGSGVTISNVVLNCGNNGAGLFTGGNSTNIGLDNGVLLTSGLATNAIGPNTAGNTSFTTNNGSDPDLQSLISQPLRDACVLSFDFVPNAEMISVQYVFASEEYPEFVCSSFNDVFGFFVSGPNPSGGNYASQNVALIPGTSLPVAINTVNPGIAGSQGSSSGCTSLAYSSLYVNNLGGTTIEYDGFTVTLFAQVQVVPGQTYTFKFAIADASDSILDSGVFIKGESFSIFTCQAGNIGITFDDGSTATHNACIGENETIMVNTSSLVDSDYTFALTSGDGTILAYDVNGDFTPEDFGLALYFVYGISYDGVIELPLVGGNIDDISANPEEGCFEVSNPLQVNVGECCSLEVECPNPNGGEVSCIDEAIAPGNDAIEIIDSCGAVSIGMTTQSEGDGCPSNPTNLNYIYTISDGNAETTCTVSYTVSDSEAPVLLNMPESAITVQCIEEVPTFEPEWSDNCSIEGINAISSIAVDGCIQFISRSWSATDACGNTTSFGQTVTIQDTTAPVFTTQLENLTLECNEPLPAVQVEATDNCGEVTVTQKETVIDFNFTTENCEGFRSQTQGGWGSSANGDNPGTYRDANFAAAFPNGLTIGCNNTLTLTSSAAVQAFLPSGGQPSVLPNGASIDADFGNTFAGQLVAATLTLGFDANDPNFSSNNLSIAELIYNTGIFTGMTVGEVVAIANEVIGGCSTEYSPAQLTQGLDLFNQNYVDGTTDNGNFSCEGETDECVYTILRCWIAEDTCGNIATLGQEITVTDTTAPEFVDAPEDFELNCNEDVPAAPELIAIDNCDDELTYSFNEETIVDGCLVQIIRTWTAIDDCDNIAEHIQTITIIDDEAPVIEEFPTQIVLSCEEVDDYTIQATDNCSEVEISYTDQLQSGGCLGWLVRTWKATDACGNQTTAVQYIQIIDNTPPTILGAGDDEIVDCSSVPSVPEVVAVDNCDGPVSLSFNEEIIEGECEAEYTLVWTWTAIDYCENTTVLQKTVQVVDNTAPEFTFIAPNAEISCGDDIPAAAYEVEDDCSEFEVNIEEDFEYGICEANYTLTRTYTAIDACGNTAIATQTIVVSDSEAPVFTFVPENLVVECPQTAAVELAEAIDNCSELTVTYDDETVLNDCLLPTTTRTFTATDACGNSNTAVQIITTVDTQAPVLSGLPEAELVLDCTADVPAPADVTAFDACEGELEVSFEESFSGNFPPAGSSAFCAALTPGVFENGLLCTNQTPWSLVLFNFAGMGTQYYTTVEANWAEYPDGTAVLSGSVVSATNPNAGWSFTASFEDKLDWNAWSNQPFPTLFKDDCNITGDLHLDWLYYVMSEGSELIGWGDYEGSNLNLAHAPSNLFYGFQVGEGANNVNLNYGMGGWFFYEGIFNGEAVDGSGDFAFDFDCCPQYQIERVWTATDCGGLTASFTQTIVFADLGGDLTASCDGDFNSDGLINTTDFTLMLGDMGCVGDCGCDLNNDQIVTTSDLVLFLGVYGSNCE